MRKNWIGPLLMGLAASMTLVKPEVRSQGAARSSAEFDVAAVHRSPTSGRRSKTRSLQSLLTVRFGLKSHWDRRDLLVYALRVGNDGSLRLRPSDTRLGVVPAPGGMTVQGMTMGEFVDEFLSRLPSIDRAVIDDTGLAGRYTFSLRVFDTDPLPGEPKSSVMAGGPEVFIHALEEVGLRLARERRSIDVLIVNSAEQTPTDY